ncbi:MAG: DNA translocase FtsK 4TM domain-containing protein, partial [Hungatella sp.]
MAGTTKITKKTNSGNKTAGRPKKQAQTNRYSADSGFLHTEVIMIASFAIAVLLFLSNFHLCGMAGDFLRRLQLGTFGMVGFVAPILLFVGTCFAISNRGNPIAAMKLTAVVIALLTLCGLAQLVFGGGYVAEQKLTAIFSAAAMHGDGGGLVGGILVSLIGSVLGTVGTYLIFIVALVICIICITEKSLVSVVKRQSSKAYQYAKEDAGRRKIVHEERKEELQRLREEQRVRGVNLDSTKLHEEIPAAVPDDNPNLLPDQPDIPMEGELPSTADIFTGKIALPTTYIVDDRVPFDTEEFISEHPTAASEPLSNEFSIPEEAKRVVTASGKIIETDTEALKKKLESKREEAAQAEDTDVGELIKQKSVVNKEYKFPPVSLLKKGIRSASCSDKEYKATAIKLQQTLQNFGVGVTVTNVSCGPSVTRYELHPEQGVKVSRIVALSDDIKLSLAASDIRIEAPIPGKSAVGIEVPNKENNIVLLRDLLEADVFQNSTSKLSFAVGKDISGQVVVTDIAKMPHLLIAGATGSGKSVCINTLIMSIIYKSAPEDVKMIMVDPKVVELSVYNGIPHLLIPVVTDPKKAAGALNWAVAEMSDRYKKFADSGVRDL